MSDRRRLIDALLAEPGDAHLLEVLADWHEEARLTARSAALRLAAALRAVPWPEAPDEACHRMWGRTRPGRQLCSTDWRYGPDLTGWAVLPDGTLGDESCWPDCWRWHGLGRLPAYATALRFLCQGKPLWARHVVRCELYSCGVLSARERDEEAAAKDPNQLGLYWLHPEWSGEPNPAFLLEWAYVLWLLRGGRAGRALSVMLAAETSVTAPLRDHRGRWADPAQGPLALAAVRTYTRAVLHTFLGARPSLIAQAMNAEAPRRRGRPPDKDA